MNRLQIHHDIENRPPQGRIFGPKNPGNSQVPIQENSKRQALGNLSNASNIGLRKQPPRTAKQVPALADFGNSEALGGRMRGAKNFAVFEDKENQVNTTAAELSQLPKNSRLNTYLSDAYKPSTSIYPVVKENRENESKEQQKFGVEEEEPSPMHLDSSCEEDVSMLVPWPTSPPVPQTDYLTVPEYEHDTYLYLRELEERHRPKVNYMTKQPDITSGMRVILIDWLVEVTEEYKLHLETLFLAVSYIDRFLSTMSVLRAKLQLVGTAAMFIASKFEEIYPPDLGEFVYITDDTYTKKQVLRMEHLILKVLSFNLASPTIVEFITRFCRHDGAPDRVLHLASYLAELSLLDVDTYAKFLPSHVAAACVALANHLLGREAWTPYMEAIFEIHKGDITECVACLRKSHLAAPTQQQQASREKYKDEQRFLGVGLVAPAATLPW